MDRRKAEKIFASGKEATILALLEMSARILALQAQNDQLQQRLYAYVTGETSSANFPIKGAAATFAKLNGPSDAFVTKLFPVNNIFESVLTYSTYLGGSASDAGFGVVVDTSRNAYVTGQTSSTDFPKKPITNPGFQGLTDAFVVKLNHNGSDLELSTLFGVGGSDSGEDIALGNAGNIYILGNTTPGSGTVVCPQSQLENNIGPCGRKRCLPCRIY